MAGENLPVENKKPDGNPLSLFDGRLVFDFQERVRFEVRDNNFDFNEGINALTDDNWFLIRTRFGMTVKPVEWLKIYAQGQDSREWLSDRPDIPGAMGAEGDDTFDLRQAYIEIGNTKSIPVGIKLGRQILSYGSERLIGAFDWGNFGRTFDAAKLSYAATNWNVDAFVSSVVVPRDEGYNQSDLFNGNETVRNQVFSGVYFSTTAIPVQTTDVYALQLQEDQTSTSSSFVTLGTRVQSKPGVFAKRSQQAADGKNVMETTPPPVGFDYDGEFAFQKGKVADLDLTALALHAGAGYTLNVACLPRLGLAYNYGSGDNNPVDGSIGTFQNLFPTNHKFYGQMDAFSWQNMHDLEVNFQFKPVKKINVKLEYHAFWLANTNDVWYRANGTTAVRPLTSTARDAGNYAGSEVDLTVKYSATKWLDLEAGYSCFFAGIYLEDTGIADNANFAYLQATLNF